MVILLMMTIGSGAMYVIAVVLPAVQAEFGVARADASMPYTAMMIGFGAGGIWMGRLADRHGVMRPLLIGAAGLGSGFIAAGASGSIAAFSLWHGLLLGFFGSAATFAPLVADTSLWFVKRRGIAVAICASGNYLAGAIWPPIVQHFVQTSGWRATYTGLGLFCIVTLPLLALAMRARPPALQTVATPTLRGAVPSQRPFGLSLNQAQALLCVAGTACCVAMAMPQVHIVAYCGDLGYGAARGAEMLSLMLACGIVSRLVSGAICDRIGGLRTLLLGSLLQGLALLLFIPFNGLVSLYVISALFGLFQGGIVPSYAIIVREHFPPAEAGARVGTVLMFTLFGMALGGWMSGKVFDLSGSYQAAFVNGIVWNLINLSVTVFLLRRTLRPPALPPSALGASA
ncbi:MAG: MFS transporter [Rubrivivax sp.]|nr:MFS transporter [Rubrivivax sp.]